MPKDPVTTLFELTDEIQELDRTQYMVDRSRELHPDDQMVQLAMDRRQADIDRKRTFIAVMMADIRSRN